jgi:rubrerythrin
VNMVKGRTLKQLQCKRCRYAWESAGDPKVCPSCKSYQWKTPAREKGEKRRVA